MGMVIWILISFIVIIFSLSVHEAAHAYAANRLGDPTARDMGRMTLNPIVHIDPIGTIILPLFLAISGSGIFGWAKPVPVNPNNFKRPLRDDALVSFAGPFSNFLIALITAIILRFLPDGGSHELSLHMGFSRILLTSLFQINVFLMIFNLLPVPPLDGSGILRAFLPWRWLMVYSRIERYGFLILIALVFTGILSFILVPASRLVIGLISLLTGFP